MQTWTEKVDLGNGIFCYKGVINKDIDVIGRIEANLKPVGDTTGYAWQPAYVGYKQLMPEYRDCNDFKFKKTDIENDKSQVSLNLQSLWQDLYDVKLPAVQDYSRMYNINNLKYWEAFNFIKYGPGQHFMEHHDHGFSYNCTLSLVAYPNDDYQEFHGCYFNDDQEFHGCYFNDDQEFYGDYFDDSSEFHHDYYDDLQRIHDD